MKEDTRDQKCGAYYPTPITFSRGFVSFMVRIELHRSRIDLFLPLTEISHIIARHL